MLNKAQNEAVKYTDGPLLIVAGAGTGKTTVITKKIAYLIESSRAKPKEILALTFTDKAAEEMLTRVDEELDVGYAEMQISTFHAFCQKILELYGLDAGLPNQFKLLTQTDAWLLIKKNFDKFNLDYYRPLGNPTKHIHELIKHFSKCKDELVSQEEYLKYAENVKLDKDNVEFEKSRLTEIANAYHTYNQLLLDNNCLDFGDLIYYTVKLLEKRPNILKALQERYKFILVDEFQDVNWAQYYLVRLLSNVIPTPSTDARGRLLVEGSLSNTPIQLTVVGDDDQCLPKSTKIRTVSGTKKICDVRRGDNVLSAVGKGYYVTSKILQTKKTTKNTEFIKIETENGHKLELTDNHIVFCYTPDTSDKKHFFVYLMERQDWGWRIGITNDPAVRLRLERGADRIILLKSCHNEEEARFYETIFSLKYNIPTVCFKERDGTQNKAWLKRVFSTIDTASNVKQLANDLNIDLERHHYSLGGVYRGEMRRVKINLEMCHRNYGVKLKYGCYRQAPAISHKLQIETSDRKAIDCLLKLGLRPTKAKKGMRIRITNVDFVYLQNIAKQVAVVSGGIIEYGFKIARFKGRTRKALMMPAKNLIEGLYVPVFNNKKLIVFEQISKIEKKKKRETVFDLEVDRTNNFIANNIVVHNSIYAFRGASVS
ncbi:UvrD-helicase domain-containing protein, partial [Candidatus Falkowbacteria bacterium]|nr:UvrD-helicase domain-containing protein [Candidatus Falkowbacteria bacterium]